MKLPDDIKTRNDFPKLIDYLGLKRGVEIGVCEGGFSETLLSGSKLDILYSIDPWCSDQKEIKAAFKRCDIDNNKQEDRFLTTGKKLYKFEGRSIIIREKSHDAHKRFEDNSLDFIYLDGSHRFTGFSLDLIQWYPKLKEGGVFSGHDYCYKYRYEVIEALNGFAVEHKQFFYLTAEERTKPIMEPSWRLIKKDRKKDEYANMIAELRPYYLWLAEHMKQKKVRITLPYEYTFNH
jgi:hypothetical protein